MTIMQFATVFETETFFIYCNNKLVDKMSSKYILRSSYAESEIINVIRTDIGMKIEIKES